MIFEIAANFWWRFWVTIVSGNIPVHQLISGRRPHAQNDLWSVFGVFGAFLVSFWSKLLEESPGRFSLISDGSCIGDRHTNFEVYAEFAAD